MRRRTVTFRVVNGSDFLATGYKLSELLADAGVSAVWSRLHGGWLLYPWQVPDVVAVTEHRGVQVRGVDRETAARLLVETSRREKSEVDRGAVATDDQLGVDDAQLILFGGDVA